MKSEQTTSTLAQAGTERKMLITTRFSPGMRFTIRSGRSARAVRSVRSVSTGLGGRENPTLFHENPASAPRRFEL
jgi:hypothetical protein